MNNALNVPYPVLDSSYLIQPPNDTTTIAEKDGIFVVNATLDFSLCPFATYPVLRVCASTQNGEVCIDAWFHIFGHNDIHQVIYSTNSDHKKALGEVVSHFIEDHYYRILDDYQHKNTTAKYHIFYTLS